MLDVMERLRLGIMADDPLVRAGLGMLLADEPDCEVVHLSSASDFENEWDGWDDGREPHAIVWDLGWEMADEVAGWVEIDLPLVLLLPEAGAAEGVWAAGGRALLLRDVAGERLVTAVRAALAGLVVIDPAIADQWLPAVDDLMLPETAVDVLTARESEVLQLIAEGLTNKAIAHQLHISDHTVKFHVNAIMTKLGAQSRTEAVVRATRLGLIVL